MANGETVRDASEKNGGRGRMKRGGRTKKKTKNLSTILTSFSNGVCGGAKIDGERRELSPQRPKGNRQERAST